MSELVTTELEQYSPGFSMPESYVFKAQRGLTQKVVEQISEMKGEPDWMRQFRLKSLEHFFKRPMPTWGADLSGIDFDNIFYYLKPMQEQGKTWEDVPADIKETFDRLGIPQAERKFLAGSPRSTRAKRSTTRCAKTWRSWASSSPIWIPPCASIPTS